MLTSLDATAVRSWCRAALTSLGQAREEIDALNVFPVPDGDTGTNLYLTMEAATEALDADADPDAGTHPDPDADLDADRAVTWRRLTQAALLGARGNSGVILSQLLRGMAGVLASCPDCGGGALRAALAQASELAYAAVATPVEGTILTVARAAADGADAAGSEDLAAVARAAARSAAEALARTPEQLEALRRAGVVDAGGRGLCVVLDALVGVVTGVTPMPHRVAARVPEPAADRIAEAGQGGPAFEVMYLLDAADETVPTLKESLGGLGDSLLVVGGDGLWNVHVHVDDVGTAIEAGLRAGRPHRIRVTHFAEAAARRHDGGGPRRDAASRAVVAVAHGPGLAALFESAEAVAVRAEAGRRPSTAELLDAIVQAHARDVVLLPNDPDVHAVAEVAAERARGEGIRVAVIPTKASVQGIAALAVHTPGRRFDDDVVAMTSAAGATRFGALTVAAREAWTWAGVCQAGDVLGLVEGEVTVIGADLYEVGVLVVERMLSAGGELVTFVAGESSPEDLAPRLAAHLRGTRPDVDTVVYSGGQAAYPLFVGVE